MADYLKRKKYRLVLVDREGVRRGDGAVDPFSLGKKEDIIELVRSEQPEHIYYFAAFHHSSEDPVVDPAILMEQSYAVNVFGFTYTLEAVRIHAPKARVFYASSSLIFADNRSKILNEQSAYAPDSMYGITKLDGLMLCRHYREKFGVFAAVGILFNHESVYRKEKFVSKKIMQGVLDIKQGKREGIELGDIRAAADWGYAPDYIDAMYKIMMLPDADEFIIATGKSHTVKEMVEDAFAYAELPWKKHVRLNKQIITRKRRVLIGDARKLRKKTGWKPSVSFSTMVTNIMRGLEKKRI